MNRLRLAILTSLVFCVARPSLADMTWDFSEYDGRSSDMGGVYGYSFPKAGKGQTDAHQASARRLDTLGNPRAQLRFQLDGKKYPSAGLGLLFPDGASFDLRGLKKIKVRIATDRPRTIRLALASRLENYQAASDTGLNLGIDTVTNGPASFQWVIDPNTLSWPQWATETPNFTNSDVRAKAFALQFEVGCESRNGSCDKDVGSLTVDDIQLEGVGGEWEAPSVTQCQGQALHSVDDFATEPIKRNNLGGWWYAYTDRSSADPLALGNSKIMDVADTLDPQTWTPAGKSAEVHFQLDRKAIYSGYAAIETQLTAPTEAGKPQPASFPELKGLQFTIDFAKDWPSSLGGVILHVRKLGSRFQRGRDHQVQIPWRSESTTWCIDVDSLRQPSWSEWITPFTPDSLEAISWEARLPSSENFASGSFAVRNIRLFGKTTSTLGAPKRLATTFRLVRSSQQWTIERRGSQDQHTQLVLRNAHGQKLQSVSFAPGQSQQRLSQTLPSGILWVQVREGVHQWSQTLLVP